MTTGKSGSKKMAPNNATKHGDKKSCDNARGRQLGGLIRLIN
jgi:hypothetical protein